MTAGAAPGRVLVAGDDGPVAPEIEAYPTGAAPEAAGPAADAAPSPSAGASATPTPQPIWATTAPPPSANGFLHRRHDPADEAGGVLRAAVGRPRLGEDLPRRLVQDVRDGRELVPARPRGGVGPTGRGAQPLRDRARQGIAGGVAVRGSEATPRKPRSAPARSRPEHLAPPFDLAPAARRFGEQGAVRGGVARDERGVEEQHPGGGEQGRLARGGRQRQRPGAGEARARHGRDRR